MTHFLPRMLLAILLAGLLAAIGHAEEKKPRLDLNNDALPEGALARLGSVRLRHGDPVSFVAFLPDRKTLLSTGCDWVVRVWDVSSGKELRRFAHREEEDNKGLFRRGTRTYPLLASLSPDGKRLATCILNNSVVCLWDVASGKELKRFPLSIPVNAIALAPDGKRLAASCSDGSARLFDLEGKELLGLGVDPATGGRFFGGMAGMSYSPDGKVLLLSGLEFDNATLKRSVRAWDVAAGKLLHRIEQDGQRNFTSAGLVFSPDGKTLAGGSWQNQLVLFDAANGKELRKLKSSIARVDTVIFSTDGKTLIGRGLADNTVGFWDVASGKELKVLGKPAAATAVRPRAFSPQGTPGLALSHDGKILAAADGNLIRLIDFTTGKDLISSTGHHGSITGLSYRGGKTLVSQSADGTIRLWDPANGKQAGAIKVPEDAYHFTMSPDGKTLVVEATDGSVRLLDAATGKERHKLQEAAGAQLLTYVFSADGRTLAIRTRLEPVAHIFSVESGKLLTTIGKAGPVRGRRFRFISRSCAVALSPDGKTLAMTGIEGGITLWQIPSGHALSLIGQGMQVREAVFSPDGRTLALDQGDGRILVHELATDTERRTYVRKGAEEQSEVVSRRGPLGAFNTMVNRNLAFSPDGRRMAFASEHRIIHVWDLLTGEEIGRLVGHQGEVSVLTFSPDSKTLASGSEDATGLIWDMTVLRSAQKPATKLDDAALENLWSELQSATGAPAFAAVGSLVAVPAQATAFLDSRLKVPEPVAEERLVKLIADLDSRRFPTRRKAMEELEKLGSLALPALTRSLEGKTSEEQKKRIVELIDKAKGQTLTPGQLQVVRAVEVLERAGTAEAKAVLARLAKGPAGALETRQARAALQRLR